ncbi:BgTH12-04793 [Blumeria graminis f. sp. triticale]|uniref:BgTH12-04793 n=1 Tax=Blumeria graminis f. sp. triticale TaxID=1689686 RepID=A0A9W4CVC2_BLUGR|nr:BgTH12-04793 [Blumeria graminis f. sp. triticale]
MKGNKMFDGIGVLFSIFWCLHSGPVIHAFPSDSNPQEVLNDFICAGSYFSAKILEENIKTACKEFPNASPSSRYPARLEDTGIFGSISDSLITGLLRYKNNQYAKGHTGNSRVVIDMDCRFFGVVIYKNNKHPKPCLELSYPTGNSDTGTDSNFFEGYNCTGAVFSDDYIKRSITIASEKKKRRTEDYPREYILKNRRSVLAWPIFATFFYGASRFFLLLTETGQLVGIRELRGHDELECQPIKLGLVPHTTRLKSLPIPETVDQENAVRYNCDGQIFKGYYILKNLQMATDAHKHYRLTKIRRFNYPSQIMISKNECPSGRWQWPLRNHTGAKKAAASVSSNVLVFNRDFDFLGVYYVKHRKHIKCAKYFVQRRPDKASVTSFPDLNVSASSCLDCNDESGCSCPEANE